VWDAFFSAVCLCAGGIIAFSPLLIRLLAAESYYDAWRYIPILTLSMIAAAFSSFMGSVYVVTKKSTASLWTSLAGAAANIALDLFLIPRIGVQGAARGGRRTAVYKKISPAGASSARRFGGRRAGGQRMPEEPHRPPAPLLAGQQRAAAHR
jgi:hypothetical protein